ncbi:protein-ADP-ribose hydrolase [Romboutsia maritimum]|uniref:Protein-ADP-ribose hydrolase n=1 Tax=Romboutsia maritimum TaxID=2020948 RepID=A0A371IT77_9FIRM|nr:protein-ADP-ribose hydrolase [Romboutsia maritimum]RDY23682.1 protein-ADP-ribose hydrolase [Romboutsia maritimum]
MNWREYAEDLKLFEVFDKNLKPMTKSERYKYVRILIDYFSKDDLCKVSKLPDNYEQRRQMLRGILNSYPPKKIEPNIMDMIHRLLLDEYRDKNIVDSKEIIEIEKDISIFRGDITTIKVDAIVNAANAKLLGCLKPLHTCIDNSIHSNSGPMLREDCNKIIEKQGHLEYTGGAKITRAYCLPSRFVLHTVGPIISDSNPSIEEEKQLISCYNSCLNLANEIKEIQSIAFCCISTGVFGYPKDVAANIAIDTVKEWLKNNKDRNLKIIFNVFSQEDEEIYKSILNY